MDGECDQLKVTMEILANHRLVYAVFWTNQLVGVIDVTNYSKGVDSRLRSANG